MIRTARNRVDDAVERLVIVSDIHSFQAPLLAVDEIIAQDHRQVQIIFNGDLFQGGPWPSEAALWVERHAGDLATIGNHDETMLQGADDGQHPPFTEAGAYQRLSAAQRDYFRARPHRLELTWRGHLIVLMHGHVTMDGEVRSFLATPDELIAAFAEDGVELFVTGHTHHAFVRECGDGLFANPGSLSAPIRGVRQQDGELHVQNGNDTVRSDDDIRSSFLSVTEEGGCLAAEIVRFDYDRKTALQALEEAGEPLMPFYHDWFAEGMLNFDRHAVSPSN